jgi:putative MATE family efflux protein
MNVCVTSIAAPAKRHLQSIRDEASGVWSMCWPIVVTMFVTSLNDTVNAKAASILGAHTQTAVAVVDQINFSLVLFLMAMGIGVNAILSRAYGAKDLVRCRYVLQSALQLSLAVGALVATLSALVTPHMVPLLIHDSEVVVIARTYSVVGAIHLLPYAVILMLTASMRSLGDAKTPMFGVVLSGALTCTLSMIFVKVPELASNIGVSGIGIASAIGAIAGSCLIVGQLRRRDYGAGLRMFALVPVQFARQVCAIGVPAGLQRLSWSLSLVGQLAIVSIAGLPESVSTAMTVGLRIESFSFLPTWAASFGVAVLVGNALGAKDKEKAFSIGWITTALTCSISLLLAVTLFTSAGALAQFMSTDPATVAELTTYLKVAAFWQPLLGVINPLTGAMQGAGETRFAMWSSIFTCWIIRIPLGLWLALYTTLAGLSIWLSVGVSISMNFALIITKYQRKHWLDTQV